MTAYAAKFLSGGVVTRGEFRYSVKDDRWRCEKRIEVVSAYALRGGTRLNLTIISGHTGRWTSLIITLAMDATG